MEEKTKELITQVKNGDKKALEKLINKNNGLIWSIVNRFQGRGHDMQDLYQIACVGFIKAVKRFDVSLDVKLSTYTVPYILGEIKKYIRDYGLIRVSRSIKELNIKIKELQKQYIEKEGREITLLELEKELKIPKEEIAMALESNKPIDSIESSCYRDNKTDKNIPLIEKISTGKDEATIISDKLALKDIIKSLNKRDQEVILLRYYKQKTQTQVAKILGVTQVQVSRIERKILDNMKKKLIS